MKALWDPSAKLSYIQVKKGQAAYNSIVITKITNTELKFGRKWTTRITLLPEMRRCNGEIF